MKIVTDGDSLPMLQSGFELFRLQECVNGQWEQTPRACEVMDYIARLEEENKTLRSGNVFVHY
jgi:hypothetical protein